MELIRKESNILESSDKLKLIFLEIICLLFSDIMTDIKGS